MELVKFFDRVLTQYYWVSLEAPGLREGLLVRIFPKKCTAETYKANVGHVNRYLATQFDDMCQAEGWPSPGSLFEIKHINITVSTKWIEALRRKQKPLRDVFRHTPEPRPEPRPEAAQQPFGWFWGRIPAPMVQFNQILFKMTKNVLLELKRAVPFDETYFPENQQFLRHYLKMHLKHSLERNRNQLYSRHVAWFGPCPEDDKEPKPFCILVNTGLLSKHDRKVELLLLLAPNT